MGSPRQDTLLRRDEWTTVLGLLVLLVLAAVLPSLEQPSSYHAFADTRPLGGIPNGANVLSNLAFVVAALVVALGLLRDASLSTATRVALAVLGLGLALTAAGSAYYHAAPDDRSLFWDRLPMTITFAGIVGAALAQRVSARAGALATVALLVVGPASVLYWRASANLMPYIVLQGGTMLAILLVVLLTPTRNDPVPWWWLIGWYAAAKVAEIFDAPIFDLTGGVVSGHTLKHLLAAVAAAGVALPLWRTRAMVVTSG
jgi:hypothetical protein